MSPINDLPDRSFLRVFAASRPLDQVESERLLAGMRRFAASWSSHESPVAAAFELRDRRFLVVAADEGREPISGCSKDALSAFLRGAGRELGAELVTTDLVFWRDGSAVRSATREEFAAQCADGRVPAGTLVFDTTIGSVGEWKAGKFERPARECWHARAFDFAR